MTPENELDPVALLGHLRTEMKPLRQRKRGPATSWDDAEFHRRACEQDPEIYALSACAERVLPEQQGRALFEILRGSRKGCPPEVRKTLDRVATLLMTALPADTVLTVFLALRRARANHKHTARAILRYIFHHPGLSAMLVKRRAAVRDSLEHALGRDTVRGLAKTPGTAGADATASLKGLLRCAGDADRAKSALSFLYGREIRLAAESPDYSLQHAPAATEMARTREYATTLTSLNRGDIAATLVNLYRGGDNEALLSALGGYVDRVAAGLPRFEGRIAFVLDASASTRGYGEREYCCISQSVALKLVLEKCCPGLSVRAVGGSGRLFRPSGATDLAGALLDALEERPNLVLIVTDGYENVLGGDLDRVAAALPDAGVRTPVVLCHSKFSEKDDLSLRGVSPRLLQLEFWHEDEFRELAISIFSLAGDRPRDYLRQEGMRRLEDLERRVRPWIAGN